MMDNKLVMVGDFGLYVPDKLWYDVATLKVDLRPVIKALKKATPLPSPKIETTTHGNYRCSTCRKVLKHYRSIVEHIELNHIKAQDG